MVATLYPISFSPIAANLEADDFGLSSLLAKLLSDPDADLTYLVIANPIPNPGTGTPPSIAEIPIAHIMTAAEFVYLSDKGFTSSPTDIPANQDFQGRLVQPLQFRSSIPLPTSGGSRGTFDTGEIVVLNNDGGLDDLLLMAWNGHKIDIKVVGTIFKGTAKEEVIGLDKAGLLFTGIVEGIEWNSSEIRIILNNPASKLNVPIQETLFVGDGGASSFEGDTNLKGRPKPLTFGVVKNISPPLVNSTNLVYQVHDGSVEAVDAVRDKGVALIFATNTTDILAWSPVSGRYATDLSTGMIRLGSSPSGLVTADVRGDNTPTYTANTVGILRRIFDRSTEFNDSQDLVSVAFDRVSADKSAAVGVHTGTSALVKVNRVFDTLMAGIDAWWRFNRTGRLTVGVLPNPSGHASLLTLTDADIEKDSITRDTPEDPVWTMGIQYQRMWTVQNPDALAASVTDANKSLYGTQYRTVNNVKTRAKQVFPLARMLELQTYYDTLVAAQAEADTRMARDSIRKDIYRLNQTRQLYEVDVGDVITVDVPRFGLAGGKEFLVCAADENITEKMIGLTLYG
jgi:hypothetical protein